MTRDTRFDWLHGTCYEPDDPELAEQPTRIPTFWRVFLIAAIVIMLISGVAALVG